MKKETKKQLLIGAALVLELLFLLLYLNGRIDRLLDSDMSSEMILGQLLARNNGILSDQWYYSTELRVLNTQLIYALFFRLSSNWHFVRMASTLVLWCVLIASYGVLCRVMGCKKSFGVTALLLAAPVSESYFRFVLAGVYYVPHLAIAFAALALNEARYRKFSS